MFRWSFSHLKVTTESGAVYFIRNHQDRSYVSSTGSSSGVVLDNALIESIACGQFRSAITIGERMNISLIREWDDIAHFVLTSRIVHIDEVAYSDHGMRIWPDVSRAQVNCG